MADGGLLVVEHAEAEKGSALAQVVELRSEMDELGAGSGSGFRITHTGQMLNLFCNAGSERGLRGHHTLCCHNFRSYKAGDPSSKIRKEKNDDRKEFSQY
jgi:hypothetical protein